MSVETTFSAANAASGCRAQKSAYNECMREEPNKAAPVTFVAVHGLPQVYDGKMSPLCFRAYQAYAACMSEANSKSFCKMAWKAYFSCQKESSKRYVCVQREFTATGNPFCSQLKAVYLNTAVPCKDQWQAFAQCKKAAALKAQAEAQVEARHAYAACVFAHKGDPKNVCLSTKK